MADRIAEGAGRIAGSVESEAHANTRDVEVVAAREVGRRTGERLACTHREGGGSRHLRVANAASRVREEGEDVSVLVNGRRARGHFLVKVQIGSSPGMKGADKSSTSGRWQRR